jgi:hypothetical protein
MRGSILALPHIFQGLKNDNFTFTLHSHKYRRLVAYFLPRKLGFNPRLPHAGFMVYRVELGNACLQVSTSILPFHNSTNAL